MSNVLNYTHQNGAVQQKPTTLVVDPTNIPQSLKNLHQWVVWQYQLTEGRWTKPPFQVNGKHAKSSDPATWTTFDNAIQHLQVNPLTDGLGLVLSAADGLTGIDMDHIYNPATGEIAGHARDVLEQFKGTHIERSPSGDGFRIWCYGKPQRSGKCTGTNKWLEVYSHPSNRYLTVTGNRYGAATEVTNQQAALDWLHSQFMVSKEISTGGVAPLSSVDISSDLINKIRASKQGALFDKLWSGAGNDHSADDIALCNMLAFWTGRDESRMDALFRQSGLMRPKWDTKHYSDGRTYGQATIEKVIKDCKNVYDRDWVRKQNHDIGYGIENTEPLPEMLGLGDAVRQFAFVIKGQTVAFINNPQRNYPYSDWVKALAASTQAVETPRKKPVQIPVSKLWLESPKRVTVDTTTFRAGYPRFTKDPDNIPAINLWTTQDRSTAQYNPAVSLFLTHIDYLFSDDAPRFLDWLAHIEQQPGVLPHRAWLHISRSTGTGRNWLAGVLCRLWPGNVAPNLELNTLLESNYNGALSQKVLAIVDEIREGGGENLWRNHEKLKQMVTAEYRLINPKYGRQYLEWNSCRWLLFSNHTGAIPLDDKDRRFEVALNEMKPLNEEYYASLYDALQDKAFIDGVAYYLRNRDLSAFRPGAHALQTLAKNRVIDASKSETSRTVESLVKYWPCDVIESGMLRLLLEVESQQKALPAAIRRTLEEQDVIPYPKQVRIGNGDGKRFYIVRNKHRWFAAQSYELATESQKVKIECNAIDYIANLEAGIDPSTAGQRGQRTGTGKY